MSKLGLVAAMEEEQQLVADAAAEVGMPEAAESLESDLVNVGVAAAEVDDAAAEIDEAQDSGEQLEGYADIVEDSLETGGMDQTAARTVELAVESIYEKFGMKRKVTMPAMESFGSADNRLSATKIALEGIKENAAKVWAAIKAAFIRFSAMIKDFFMKMFDANTKLANRATAAKVAAGKIGSATAAKEEIAPGSFGAALSVGGKLEVSKLVTTFGNLAKGLENTESVSTKFGKWLETVKGGTKEEFDGIALFDFSEGLTIVGSAGENGMANFRSPELPGNKAITAYAAADKSLKGAAAVKAIKGSKVGVSEFFKATAAADKKDIPTLSKADMVKLADATLVVTKSVAAGKAHADALLKQRDSFITRFVSAVNVAKAEDMEAGKRNMEMSGVANAVNRISAGQVSSVVKYALGVGKAAMDYVEMSAKQYGAKAAAPAKKEPEAA